MATGHRKTASFRGIATSLAAMAWAIASPLAAQVPPTPSDSATEQSGAPDASDILVTGTSIRGVAPTGSATVTMSASDIQATGLSSPVDVIRTLPQIQNIGADETRTSGRDGAADNSGRGSAINLRGLGNNATLLLIDGRRIAPNGTASAFGDPNQIPDIALERVEVVTDGASAVYGSDAVAGVVNLILRKNYDGILTSGRYISNGDYRTWQAGLLAGTNWESGGIVVAYQYQDRTNMLQGESAYLRRDQRSLGGNDQRLSGTTTSPGPFSGNIITGSGSTARIFGIPAVSSGVPSLSQITAGLGDPNLADAADYTDYVPTLKRHTATAYIHQEIGNLKLFAEGFYNHRNSSAERYPTTTITVKPGTPFYIEGVPGASATTGYSIQYPLYSAFGPIIDTYPERSGSVTLGGDMPLSRDWNVSAYGTYSATSLCNCTPVFNNIVLQALVDTGAFNPYVTSPQSESVLSQFRSDARQAVKTRLWDFGVKVDGRLFDLPGGSIRAAIGAEHTYSYQSLVRIGADRTTDPEIPIGTPAPGVPFTVVPRQTPFASRDTEKSRKIDAIYAELFVPIVGPDNSMAGIRRLDLSLAIRHDRYSDVGSTTNPKVGLTWRPFEDLNLRGSFGTSFRAPSLPESNPFVQGGVRSFSFANRSGDLTIPLTNVTNGTTNGIALDGGSATLQPERATTWSIGGDYAPSWAPGLTLSATYYNVNYKDRIESLSGIFSTFLASPENRELYAPFIVAAPQPSTCVEGVQSTYNPIYLPYLANPSFVLSTIPQCSYGVIFNAQTTNLGKLTQQGIDAQIAYTTDTDIGQISAGLAVTKILSLKRQLSPISGMVDVLDTIQFPVSTRGRANLGWASHNGVSFMLFGNYTGSYLNNAPLTVGGIAQPVSKVPSWTTFDASLSFDTGPDFDMAWLRDVRFTISAQNMFNKNPPLVLSSATTPFAFDAQNANVLGRIMSFSITKQW